MVFSTQFSKIKESGIIWKLIVFLYVSAGVALTIFGYSKAVTVRTVCAGGGCDFTTVSDAVAASTSGDTVRVTSLYTGAGEASSITFGTDLILECVGGPTVGTAGATTTIAISANSTVQNCTFLRTALETTGVSQTGITVTGNTFITSQYSSINFGQSLGMVVSNNINVRKVILDNAVLTNPVLTGNTFYVTSGNVIEASSAAATSLTITNNTFTGYSEMPFAGGAVWISGAFTDITFATNTINLSVAQTSVAYSAVYLNVPGTLNFSGNQISVVNSILKGVQISAGSGSVSTIRNNTIKFGYDSLTLSTSAAIEIVHTTGVCTVDASYNLLYGFEGLASSGMVLQASGGSIALTNDYNAYYGQAFLSGLRIVVSGTVTGSTVGSNSKTNIDPQFRIWNVSTSDDLYPAPYSDYLDVNGTQDIGAYSGARRSTIYVDAAATAATINYSSVDTTSTIPLLSTVNRLRSGDTISLITGTYALPSFSSSTIASGLTITGASAASTILTAGGTTLTDMASLAINNVTIRGVASSHGLILSNTSSSVFTNVIFDSASTAAITYIASNPIYSYLGTTYNGGAGLGMTASSTLILSDSSCNFANIDSPGTDVTAYLNGSSNVHLAVVTAVAYGNAKLTGLVPNNYAASGAALNAQCGGNVVFDAWVADVFTVSGGVYTFDSAAVSSAGLTMASGFIDPPYLGKIAGYAGVKLINSSSNTFTTVTSTGNVLGMWFDGTSASNIVQDSYFSSNSALDFISTVLSGSNSIKNTTYSHSLVSILGQSTLNIYQKIYVAVRDAYNVLIGGATVAYSSANAIITGTLETLNTGTSTVSTNLLASIYTGSAHVDTTGGYNPYTFNISATSTYLATTTAASLISPYQTVTLYMTTTTSETPSTPPPSGGSFQSIAPSITSFLINSGALSTVSSTVNIILNAAEAATMVISEDINFVGLSTTAFLNSFVVQLSQTPGLKTLYAKVYNAQGLASGVASSTIQLDPAASTTSTLPTVPTGSIVFSGSIVGGVTSSTSVGLGISYSAGVTEMKISGLADLQGAAWQTAATTTPWTLSVGDGIKRVYIKFKTAEGAESSIYSTSLQLDQTGPSEPQFLGAIEKGSFVEQPSVISGTADNQTLLRVSLIKVGTIVSSSSDTSNSSGVWNISVPKLSLGRYVVNARAYDAVGNSSSVASTYFDIIAATEEIPPPIVKKDDPVVPGLPPESPTPGGEKTVGSVGSGDQGVGTPPPTAPSTQSNVAEEAPNVPLSIVVEADTAIISESVSNQVSVATAEVSKVVAASVKSASKAITAVQNSPQVQAVNQAVVVPTVAVAAAASVGSAVNGAQAINYLKFLFTQPFFLLARKRRKGWGTVYNAITKMPMDLAMVRLIDVQTGRVVQSQVTDKLGRYQIFAKLGEFKLDIVKPGYQFPAAYLKGQTEDGKFTDLYTGDVINPASATAISYNTPLDPIGVEKTGDELIKLARKKKLAVVVGNLGLLATAVSLIISPTPLVAGFLVVHVASHFMFKRLATAKKPETWGVISDSAGKPLENAIVRVFDKQYNKLLETQITDDKGRYAFLVGKNDYYMMIEKLGYEKVITEAISVPESENGSVLAKNVQVLSSPLTV